MPTKPTKIPARQEIAALKVHQWLPAWDAVGFDPAKRRRRPAEHFYLFSLPAASLKALCGIHRRSASSTAVRADDTGIQRRHEPDRSAEIGRFIQYGFPWSNLSDQQQQSDEFNDLRKPGWLPTAVVLNILLPKEKRMGHSMADDDTLTLKELDNGQATIVLPKGFGKNWHPKDLHPAEVIDGQHRLWAFDDSFEASTFELPVVAFYGLDISWQAYQFWTINIKPKRINPSLAFDLYPLLRTEDWLERREGHSIYREARAQELTESLWSHPDSPWHQRINMLGEPGVGRGMVTQAAWIRSLLVTYIKSAEGSAKIGGLFGSVVGSDGEALPWNRAQQAAFLIFVGSEVKKAVGDSSSQWAKRLRTNQQEKLDDPAYDAAFFGHNTLLATDQGIRGLLFVTNDLCYVRAEAFKLSDWMSATPDSPATDQEEVTRLLKELGKRSVGDGKGACYV